jgi:anti-sigma regulatory factor (Ser/Thr protein kinase)
MNVTVKADINELDNVLEIIRDYLDSKSVSEKFKLGLEIALEEIFTNIINYSYEMGSDDNKIEIIYNFKDNPSRIVIKIIDKGTPFNPLKHNDPDTTLNANDRDIGGLGIFLVKKNINNIDYEFKDNQNILTIEKILDF